jgi:hypothetical protein
MLIIISSAGDNVIPPMRWFMSIMIPLAFVGWGLKKKSLDKSGAILGICKLFISFQLN